MVDFISQQKLACSSADSASSSGNVYSNQMTVARLLAYFICFIYLQFNSIQFNLFHPRIILHDVGQVK
jgi:hypothetical protein